MQYKIKHIDEIEINSQLETLLPNFKLAQFCSYSTDKLQDMHLAGWSLLIELLEENGYSRTLLTELLCNDYGKPYVDDVYFSISYSEPYVIVAISDEEIGVDIEVIDELTYDDVKPFLNKKEKISITPESSVEEYYTIWTKKEAVLKLIGTGFQKEPDSVNVNSSQIKVDGKVVSLCKLDSVETTIAFIASYR